MADDGFTVNELKNELKKIVERERTRTLEDFDLAEGRIESGSEGEENKQSLEDVREKIRSGKKVAESRFDQMIEFIDKE